MLSLTHKFFQCANAQNGKCYSFLNLSDPTRSGACHMVEQLELFSVPNPCKGLCQTNARGYCLGCFRSREERFQWQTFTDPQKRHVLRLCNQRRYRAQKVEIATDLSQDRQGSLF